MIIDPQHFEYLVLQRGEVSDYRKDFDVWKEKYLESLEDILRDIRPALPEKCDSILDIGSGLGGIDILLNKHYGGKVEIGLLDGLDDPPEVKSHHRTFNSAKVAQDFHFKNGSRKVSCFYPVPDPIRPYDLIISFSAYCFHILPGDYMDVVKDCSRPGTTLIFDVRITRRDWLEETVRAFGKPTVLTRSKKRLRLAWEIV